MHPSYNNILQYSRKAIRGGEGYFDLSASKDIVISGGRVDSIKDQIGGVIASEAGSRRPVWDPTGINGTPALDLSVAGKGLRFQSPSIRTYSGLTISAVVQPNVDSLVSNGTALGVLMWLGNFRAGSKSLQYGGGGTSGASGETAIARYINGTSDMGGIGMNFQQYGFFDGDPHVFTMTTGPNGTRFYRSTEEITQNIAYGTGFDPSVNLAPDQYDLVDDDVVIGGILVNTALGYAFNGKMGDYFWGSRALADSEVRSSVRDFETKANIYYGNDV